VNHIVAQSNIVLNLVKLNQQRCESQVALRAGIRFEIFTVTGMENTASVKVCQFD